MATRAFDKCAGTAHLRSLSRTRGEGRGEGPFGAQPSTEQARIRLSWHSGRPVSAAQSLNTSCAASDSAVLRRRQAGPVLQPGNDRWRQDEGVLADHAQKGRPGIAAHLAEPLGQRLPQPDDVICRPRGEPGAKAAMLAGDSSIAAALSLTDLSLPQWRISRASPSTLPAPRPTSPAPGAGRSREHLLEGRPFRVDQAVLEPGAEDAQLTSATDSGRRALRAARRGLRRRQPRFQRARRAVSAPRDGSSARGGVHRSDSCQYPERRPARAMSNSTANFSCSRISR